MFGTVERSLDFSCPEAARLGLTDPRPIQFHLYAADPAVGYQGSVPPIDAGTPETAGYSWETRSLVIAILQDRRYPVSKRLILVAQLCDLLTSISKLPGISESAKQDQTFEILYRFREYIESGLLDDNMISEPIDHGAQLRLVLELINARIRMDFVSQRYLDMFQEFASGLQLNAGSDWNALALRYGHAYRDYYAPFMDRHEYLLENYLVSYAYKTVFPFAWSNGDVSVEHNQDPAHRYMVMASYYSIAKAVMIGLSGKYKSDFGIHHVVRCIHSSSRAFEHCISYPPHLLQILAGKGLTSASQMAILTRSYPEKLTR